MKKIFSILAILIALFLGSCIPETPVVRDYKTNFEALWKIIDERYCFLDEKGVDWDEVHKRYLTKIETRKLNDLLFFNLMDSMLSELKDGHVNLYSDFDISRYDKLVPDPTTGLNIYARSRHISGNLFISGGMKYGLLTTKDRDMSFGYISYSSFSNSLGNMKAIFTLLQNADAIILDVRGNGGGSVENSDKLVSYFLTEKTLVGYTVYKTGPARDAFSEPKAHYITPNKYITYTEKPLIILQDRSCFSATNDFLYKVALAKNVTRIGETSGGGTGMPATSELPNGWKVRYSAVKSYDKDMNQLEGGFVPDIEVHNESYYENPNAIDNILVTAVQHIYTLKNE